MQLTNIHRVTPLLIALLLIGAACSSDDSGDTTTTSPAAPTTTEPAATTSTAPPETTTTTAAPETTTTTQPPAYAVDATGVIGVLSPYGPGGEDLFPPESVEAHWYQWEGSFVVLYRGYDATSDAPLCPGNSIYDGTNWVYITNSPLNGEAAEICVMAPEIATPPVGASTCGSLLYYQTAIPTEIPGYLFGTLELSTADATTGQTSQILADLQQIPEFEPGLPAYDLPDTAVDPAQTVTC